MKTFHLRAPSLAFMLLTTLVVGDAQSAVDRSSDRIARGLEALRTNDQRAAIVSHALRRANRDLCPRRAPLFGWVLHSAAQYSPRVRATAQRRFALLGDFPAVLGLVPGGPASAAGLQVDDVLMAVNGKPLGLTEVSGPASYEPLRKAVGALIQEAGAPIDLLVARRGVQIHTKLKVVPGCAYETQVDPSPDLQASADAQRVFITTALVEFTADNDELAAILAHEYAHIVLGHPPDPHAPRRAVGGKPPRQRTADQEFAADRLGLRLARRAGFDLHAAPRLLDRLGRSKPWLRLLPSSHPRLGERRKRVMLEIERLQKQPAETVEASSAADGLR